MPGSSEAPSSGSERLGAIAGRRRTSRTTRRTGCAQRAEDAAAARRFIAELDRRLRERPARATWAEHLDYLQALLARYVDGADDVIVALRGLERFTALEAEVDFDWFLDVVKRAIGTLRSEDVIDSRPGAFAARGVNIVAVNSLVGIEFARVWILGATERAFPPPVRQDPILLDDERGTISSGLGTRLAPRSERGSEEALVFALACEAARERLVVSYARRATGESRPRLPSVFFRELASQLEGERVSAEDGAAAARAQMSSGSPATRSARRSGRATPTTRTAVSAAAARARLRARARPHLPAGARHPPARDRHLRAGAAGVRAGARRRPSARFADRYSAWDGALGPDALDGDRRAAARRRAAVGDVAGELRDLSAAVHARAAAADQGGDEPEQVVRIDALSRGSVIHRIFERFYDEAKGKAPAPLAADAEQRMRRIAGEECDARARPRRDRLSGDVGGRSRRADRGLRALAGARARARDHARAAAGRGRGAVRRADGRREAGNAVAGRADRDRPALRDAPPPRPDRPRQLGHQAHPLPGRRLQDGQEVRREAGRAAGRADAAAAAVCARRSEAARDRRRQPAGPRTCTRPAGASSRRSSGSPTSSPPATPTWSRCSTRSSRGARRGDFIVAPHEGACDYCPFNGICDGARGDYADAQGGRRPARPARDRDPGRPVSERLADQAARERITGDLDANLGVEAGAGTGKTTVLVSGSPTCSRRARRPWTSSS